MLSRFDATGSLQAGDHSTCDSIELVSVFDLKVLPGSWSTVLEFSIERENLMQVTKAGTGVEPAQQMARHEPLDRGDSKNPRKCEGSAARTGYGGLRVPERPKARTSAPGNAGIPAVYQ